MRLDWLLIGLGNPGTRYRGTWHNAGFDVLDLLLPELASAQSFGAFSDGLWQEKPNMHWATLRRTTENGTVKNTLLVKPQFYMNLSGKVLPALRKRYEFCPERTIVLLDNLDLQPGRLKLKFGGSSSSHNGLRSLREYGLKADFWRLFIGIGHPGHPEQVSSYVLSKPRPAAQVLYHDSLQRASRGLAGILAGAEPEMLVSELNRKV